MTKDRDHLDYFECWTRDSGFRELEISEIKKNLSKIGSFECNAESLAILGERLSKQEAIKLYSQFQEVRDESEWLYEFLYYFRFLKKEDLPLSRSSLSENADWTRLGVNSPAEDDIPF